MGLIYKDNKDISILFLNMITDEDFTINYVSSIHVRDKGSDTNELFESL
ncbi:MAG: hypothetical protein JXR58_02115 [Bacteroidales bacterium]|nr:hypothetical protein [Bacteroidales bacterium]